MRFEFKEDHILIHREGHKIPLVKRFMSTDEAATYLGKTRNAIQKLIHNKKLPAKKFRKSWMIKVEDLNPS